MQPTAASLLKPFLLPSSSPHHHVQPSRKTSQFRETKLFPTHIPTDKTRQTDRQVTMSRGLRSISQEHDYRSGGPNQALSPCQAIQELYLCLACAKRPRIRRTRDHRIKRSHLYQSRPSHPPPSTARKSMCACLSPSSSKQTMACPS